MAIDTPTGKVLVDERDTTSVDNIYAIGDAAYVRIYNYNVWAATGRLVCLSVCLSVCILSQLIWIP